MKIISTILSAMLMAQFTASAQSLVSLNGREIPASKIIETIILNTGSPEIPSTVDVIKEGAPDTRIKGIVTTMFATMDVLREAVNRNCNLIIVHEPLYYNHRDDTEQLAGDPVFLEKQKFIRDNKLVIWRFHDYIHSMKPDGIESGMLDKLGWKKYTTGGTNDHFLLPETTLGKLTGDLRKIFPGYTFYVIGNPDMKLTRVCMAPGAPGSEYHLSLLRRDDVEVMLAGEAPQWETYEYARDAVAQGRKKAVIFLGHIASEENGMNFCATWLKQFIKDIPVTFIESGPSYKAY